MGRTLRKSLECPTSHLVSAELRRCEEWQDCGDAIVTHNEKRIGLSLTPLSDFTPNRHLSGFSFLELGVAVFKLGHPDVIVFGSVGLMFRIQVPPISFLPRVQLPQLLVVFPF